MSGENIMIVTATADQVARLPDGRYVIAKPKNRCGHHGNYLRIPTRPKPEHYGDSIDRFGACVHCFPDLFDGSNSPTVPPADLVAVTEPCQTCFGSGEVWRQELGSAVASDCRRCHAGYPLFDLKVECDGCRCTKHGPGVDVCCACDESPGFVTHAGLYVPGPLLPITSTDREWRRYAHCTVDGGRLTIWTPDRSPHGSYVTEHHPAPPAAVSGWYAVIAERSGT